MLSRIQAADVFEARSDREGIAKDSQDCCRRPACASYGPQLDTLFAPKSKRELQGFVRDRWSFLDQSHAPQKLCAVVPAAIKYGDGDLSLNTATESMGQLSALTLKSFW